MTQSSLAIRTCDGPSARWPWRMGGPAASPFQEACTSVETRKLIAIEYRVVLTLVSSTSPLINGWSARLDVRSKKVLELPYIPQRPPKEGHSVKVRSEGPFAGSFGKRWCPIDAKLGHSDHWIIMVSRSRWACWVVTNGRKTSWRRNQLMSAFDPKRTFNSWKLNLLVTRRGD